MVALTGPVRRGGGLAAAALAATAVLLAACGSVPSQDRARQSYCAHRGDLLQAMDAYGGGGLARSEAVSEFSRLSTALHADAALLLTQQQPRAATQVTAVARAVDGLRAAAADGAGGDGAGAAFGSVREALAALPEGFCASGSA